MSLSVDGVWKAGVWAETVWADGVWREGDPPESPINPRNVLFVNKEPNQITVTSKNNTLIVKKFPNIKIV